MSATLSPQGKPPKRRMKETLFTRYRNTVEPMMLADNRKPTLQAIRTDAFNKAINDQNKRLRKRSNQEGKRYPHPVEIRIV